MKFAAMISFYNSLHRKKEEFIPREPGRVGLYTCGPTVYDFQHIGNMRAYIGWDILKRFLIAQGFEVRHIMNITDVGHLTSDADAGEDKLEVARKRERLTAWQVAEKYFEQFKADTTLLNILPPTKYVRATDLVQQQIAFVSVLEKKGYVYKTGDGMYFDTAQSPDYGALGRLNVAGQQEGARVEANPEKRNATDFAVWKFSPPGEKRDMEWESPWGVGFPGWHLECSVIAREFLGDEFDIHTGGIDHLTVHHPNEIAQSQAVTGMIPARFWLHNNFINYQDKRISKSAGTFVKVSDIVCGGVTPLAYRYYVLQTHYRKELAYSWDALKAAAQGLQNIYKEISFFDQPSGNCPNFEADFTAALSDDLNCAKALDVMQRLIKSAEPSAAKLQSLFMMDEVLGLGFENEWRRRSSLPEAALLLLEERKKARAEGEYELADALREKMTSLGVEVKDGSEGQRAARIQ